MSKPETTRSQNQVAETAEDPCPQCGKPLGKGATRCWTPGCNYALSDQQIRQCDSSLRQSDSDSPMSLNIKDIAKGITAVVLGVPAGLAVIGVVVIWIMGLAGFSRLPDFIIWSVRIISAGAVVYLATRKFAAMPAMIGCLGIIAFTGYFLSKDIYYRIALDSTEAHISHSSQRAGRSVMIGNRSFKNNVTTNHFTYSIDGKTNYGTSSGKVSSNRVRIYYDPDNPQDHVVASNAPLLGYWFLGGLVGFLWVGTFVWRRARSASRVDGQERGQP